MAIRIRKITDARMVSALLLDFFHFLDLLLRFGTNVESCETNCFFNSGIYNDYNIYVQYMTTQMAKLLGYEEK